MAAISERNGRFLVRVRRRGFPTVTKTFTRRSDAAAWGRRVEADMEAGRWSVGSNRVPTLKEAIRDYRVSVASKLKGASTYRYRFDEFEAMPLAQRPVNEIRPAELAVWRDEQLLTRKPDTVIRKLAMLSGIFTWAARERGWLKDNPVASLRWPRASPGRSRTLSDEELHWLMVAARSSPATWLPNALTVLMTTAMRRSELLCLDPRDIDLQKGVALLRDTKNGRPRLVPLAPMARQALQRLIAAAEARGSTKLLPVGPPGSITTSFRRTIARARALYRTAMQEAGQTPDPGFMSDLRLHDLRHHAITAWASAGALSLPELMALSGHRTAHMLARYTHLEAVGLAGKLAAIEPRPRSAEHCTQAPGMPTP